MSSVKPRPPVKPRTISKNCKSDAIVTNPSPSVSNITKILEEKLKFPDYVKTKVTHSRTADVQLHTPKFSRSHSVHTEQGKKDTVNPDNGVESGRRSLDQKRTCRVTPQIPAFDISGSVDVGGKKVNRKNARQTAEVIDKESQNVEARSTNDHLEEIQISDVEVWVYPYSPVSMLMKQIKESVEMPAVSFNALPEMQLVQVLSLYNEDIDRARIHIISTWNDLVNQLLESTGYSSSYFYRNIASLILCKVDIDITEAWKCLGNDRVKLIVTRHVSKLEQKGQPENSTPSGFQDNENSRMNPDVWNDVIEDVMDSWWKNLECPIEQKCQICWETFPSDQCLMHKASTDGTPKPNYNQMNFQKIIPLRVKRNDENFQKIFGLSFCQCVVCNPCMKRYFEVMIHDGYVANFICPVCHLPDVEDVNDASLHFQLLEPKLQTLLSSEDFQAYQHKMTEWNLVRNPNFLWCINATCHSGFLIEENGYSRVMCPECKMEMCHKCKKPWEEQHMGLTCKMFQDWKKSNDPEYQEAALAQQLQENGIDCPRCRRRYLLSKGGCIHFMCTFCHYEFCSSCSRPFVRSCKKSNHCKQSGGLHCHHPRNCLYYLRDRSVVELHKLLKNNNVSYETSLPTHNTTTCPVLEEQDTDNGGFTRELCKANSFHPGHAGLCEKHYKEYLAGIIQRNRIDPAAVMSQSELIRELQHSGITKIPKQLKTETETQYQCRLTQLLMADVTLPRQGHR